MPWVKLPQPWSSLGILGLALLGAVGMFWVFQGWVRLAELQESPEYDGIAPKNFFSHEVPADSDSQRELAALRSQSLLASDDEEHIRRMVEEVSTELWMPPASLWCLLFQESRLDHLANVDGQGGAQGLGQFLSSTFLEINYELERYSPANVRMFQKIFDEDIRPVRADKNNLFSHSSYFFIPTAVATSAVYYNNRYLQLKRVLERNHIRFHPQILWLFAAMAYNKGSRGVIAIWQDVRRTEGDHALEGAMTRLDLFEDLVNDSNRVQRALRRIWPDQMAVAYAGELRMHINRVMKCALISSGRGEGSF